MNRPQESVSFRLYFEGQALRISSDMEEFAQEAIDALMKGGWEYGQVAYQREVDSERYGKREIKIVPQPKVDGDLGAGNADYRTGVITIFTKPGWNLGELFVDFIVHELVHMFDPKLNNPKLAAAKQGVDAYFAAGKPMGATGDEEVDKTYYQNPWEQDAFMAQSARDSIRHKQWLWDGDWASIQQNLSKIRPETAWEKAWYGNKKMWQKYLNTVYQELQRRKSQAG